MSTEGHKLGQGLLYVQIQIVIGSVAIRIIRTVLRITISWPVAAIAAMSHSELKGHACLHGVTNLDALLDSLTIVLLDVVTVHASW